MSTETPPPSAPGQSLPFERVAVIGAGTMGHGIAQICAMAGCEVRLYDVADEPLMVGLEQIAANLRKGVERGKVEPELAEESLARIDGTTVVAVAADGAQLVIEAVPERMEIKQALFSQLDALCEPDTVFGTNTSSLSVAGIATAVTDTSRVLGMHFFNPVHIMKLLELIHHPNTDPGVLARVQEFGARIGKECITVRDVPGFATSRLGVALGMEAIRMLEDGVASAEDIDKAMVLGYRHPVGPLRLTDMVGLDVRLAIGEYLVSELDNPAFEPPTLMRRMVAEGKLGKKTGEGFYRW